MRLATGFCVAFCRASVPDVVSASSSCSSGCSLAGLTPDCGTGLVCSCERAQGPEANIQTHGKYTATCVDRFNLIFPLVCGATSYLRPRSSAVGGPCDPPAAMVVAVSCWGLWPLLLPLPSFLTSPL